MDLPLVGPRTLEVRALYLAQRIDLRGLEARRLATGPVVVAVGEAGAAALLRYGVVVLFGVDADAEAALRRQLRAHLFEPLEAPVSESVIVELGHTGPEHLRPGGVVGVEILDLPRMQVLADVLAKSVILDHFEESVRSVFEQVEPLAGRMAQGKVRGLRGRVLTEHIGRALLVQAKTLGRVEVSEKPDVLWDHPEHERFFHRLADEFELVERHVALERKLTLVAATAQTVLDLLLTGHSLRVEWYIVVLIVVEIGLTLYELFLR